MPPSDVVLHPAVAPRAHGDAPLLLADHRGAGLSELLPEILQAGLRARVTRGLGESRDALQAGVHRALLLDPAGLGAVELAELRRVAPQLPALLLVDAEAPDAGLDALEAAADGREGLVDVAPRGARVRELVLRIGALERASAWRHRAEHDERTECLRPEEFDRRLRELSSGARRHDFPLALVLLDLDDFGRVNKRHDHTVGDRVIARVGAVLRAALRCEDLAGRIGGDEFVVALPFTDRAEAVACARRMQAELARTPIRAAGGAEVPVTASAGVAVLAPGDEASIELVRHRAEIALRAAKTHGGGACVAWSGRAAEGALAAAE